MAKIMWVAVRYKGVPVGYRGGSNGVQRGWQWGTERVAVGYIGGGSGYRGWQWGTEGGSGEHRGGPWGLKKGQAGRHAG